MRAILDLLLAFPREWASLVWLGVRRRKSHPNGGICYTCDKPLPEGETECRDCWEFRQW